MRKLLSFHFTSLDGYYEGPGQAFDWPVVDAEFNQLALRQLDEAGTLLFGRVTYVMTAGYWPTAAAEQDDQAAAASAERLGGNVLFRRRTRRSAASQCCATRRAPPSMPSAHP